MTDASENADNVVYFTGITKLDLPPERVLNAALQQDLGQVIVIGWGKDDEYYFSSSVASGSEVVWLLQGSIAKLMKIGNFI